jgi:hypothetical protein
MINIDVRGLSDVSRLVTRLSTEMPAVVAKAINNTAFKVRDAERAEMTQVFDRVKPWVLRTVYVTKATPQRLSAAVGPNDYFSRGGFQGPSSLTPWEKILAPHVYGGNRLAKASERRLQQAGILPNGWVTVPGKGARLDSYGNMSGGQIVEILVWLNAMSMYSGDNTNRRDRQRDRKNKMEQRGESFFAIRPGARSHLHPGVYRKFANGRIKPVLIFVSRATYRRRLRWFEIGNRVVADVFPRELQYQYRRALNQS